MKIGYARVSTGLQNLDLQEDSLTSEGCQKIFTRKFKRYHQHVLLPTKEWLFRYLIYEFLK